MHKGIKKLLYTLLFEYAASGEGFWLSGNTSRIIVGGRGSAVVTFSDHYRLEVRPSYFFGKVNGRITDREARSEGMVYLSTRGFNEGAWYGFLIGIYSQSQLRNVDSRWHGGGGITHPFIRNENHQLSASAALLAEKTTFSSGQERTPLRCSVRLDGRISLTNNGLSLGLETFLKPALSDASDVIWLSLVTLQAALHNRISLQVGLDYTYESVVPEGLKPYDSRLTFGVRINS